MNKINFIRANKTKFGGAEVYLSRLTDALREKSVEFDLIHSNIPKLLPSWLRVILFNIKVCSGKKEQIYFSLERISCPDIYRAGDGVHKVFMMVEKKSMLNPLHTTYLYLEKRCFNNAKKIIANSNMIKEQIIQTYGIDPQKIKVVYNGIKIDKPNFNGSLKKLQKEYDIGNDPKEKIFLYVGSGFKRKGVEEFLQILSKLEYGDFKAFVIGKEKKMDHYKNLARQLNIADKVIFTGPRTDVKDFYSIADIFLFPTRYEPFSNVVLEAMCYSNAVVTTRQNGASEILDDEYIMSNSKDYSIIKRLDELLNDDKKLDIIKEKNIQTVKDFSIEKNVEETLDVINEVIKMKESK